MAVPASPIIIKKYANRRLYDTESSSYITLDHLAGMTKAGREFKVVDARSGDDITRQVLTQIIMEHENGTQTMLPEPFLRQLIAMYGGAMSPIVPKYLEASMEALKVNGERMKEAALQAVAGTPFEALARQNMAMMEQAAAMFAPMADAMTRAASSVGAAPADAGGEPSRAAEPARDEEVARLRAEMAALEAKLAEAGRS